MVHLLQEHLALAQAGAEGSLALLQRPLRLLALGVVARDLGKTLELARATTQSRHQDIGPEARAILAHAPALFRVAAVASRLPQHLGRVPACALLRRVEYFK